MVEMCCVTKYSGCKILAVGKKKVTIKLSDLRGAGVERHHAKIRLGDRDPRHMIGIIKLLTTTSSTEEGRLEVEHD